MLTRSAPFLAGLTVLAVLTTACGEEDDIAVPTSPTLESGALTADLEILYEHPEAEVSFEYGVECGPDSSELTGAADRAEVDASAACNLLDLPEVTDRLLTGADSDVCTEVYGGPDTATITGTLFGDEVDAIVDRTNGCGIADWEELLDELLPPAIGVVSETD